MEKEVIDMAKSSFKKASHDLSNSPFGAKVGEISFVPENKNAESRSSEESISKRVEKIKNWIKDPLNASLVGVLIFALIVRLYYFIQVGNQPLWWDELVYGSLAKNMVTHQWDGAKSIIWETTIRPLLLPFIWSLLLRIGIQEFGARFLLELVPSFLSVVLVYLIGKEIYGKKVGLIAAFIFSTLWIHLFYTVRLLTNIPAMIFLFTSIFFFIKSTNKDLNPKLFALSLFLLSISTLMRYPIGVIFFAYLFFLIFTKKLKYKKSSFWISGIIGILPLLLFFLFNQINYGNIFPTFLGSGYVDTSDALSKPLAFNLLNFIPVFLKKIFFVFFLAGLGIALFELVVGYGFISKIKKLRGTLLITLILAVFYGFFIFYIRSAEDRYFLPISITFCIFAAIGLNYSFEYIKKYNKHLAIFGLMAILVFGAYSQIAFADSIIENKKVSYLQMKQAFIWMKDNTPKESVITGSGIEPYSIFYSEMDHIQLSPNSSDKYKISEADYLIQHVFSGQPEYIQEYISENQDSLEIVNAFFFDESKNSPAVIIYKIN